jgi:hypothetical protein
MFRNLFALWVLVLAGCSASDGDTGSGLACVSNDECPSEQYCVSGRCAVQPCEARSCPDDGVCVAGSCRRPAPDDASEADADAGDTEDGSGDASLPDGSGDDAGADEDGTDGSGTEPNDATPDVDFGPLEFSTEPANGAREVPPDTQITIRFNQPMNAIRLIPSTLQLTDFDGRLVTREIFFDEATWEVQLRPTVEQPLLAPGTPYLLRLSERIQSASGEDLGRPRTVSFSTSLGPSSFYDELATAYAPVVYQQIENPSQDVFTRVDFDGNFSAANNHANANGALFASAYWTVIESRTHFFIGYWYYYPRVQLNPTVDAEHDWVFAQVVVAKDSDRLGRFRFMSTGYHEAYALWAADPSFYGPGDGVSAGARALSGALSADGLEGGRHARLFVESGRHGACLVNAANRDAACSPSGGASAPFESGTTGAIFRAGAATRLGDATPTALTYALLPALSELWARRDSTEGETALFGGVERYRAPADGAGSRPGDDVRVPISLASSYDGGSFGDLPFMFTHTRSATAAGQWALDPAFVFSTELSLPERFATDYCYQPFFGIDLRGSDPECSPRE